MIAFLCISDKHRKFLFADKIDVQMRYGSEDHDEHADRFTGQGNTEITDVGVNDELVAQINAFQNPDIIKYHTYEEAFVKGEVI